MAASVARKSDSSKMPVYRISLSNSGSKNAAPQAPSPDNAGQNGKLTTFAQVKAGKEPLMSGFVAAASNNFNTNIINYNSTRTPSNNNKLSVQGKLGAKSASTTSLQPKMTSSTAFGGSSLKGASNYVIKIPVSGSETINRGSTNLVHQSSKSAANIGPSASEQIDLMMDESRSKTVSVTPGGKTVMTPEDPGKLRVYVQAADKPLASNMSSRIQGKEVGTVYDPCRMSPLESRYSLTLSSGQLSPAEDGLDSGLSSNGTTPPPQARRLVSSTGEVESDGDSDSTSSCHDSLNHHHDHRIHQRLLLRHDEENQDDHPPSTRMTSVANSPPTLTPPATLPPPEDFRDQTVIPPPPQITGDSVRSQLLREVKELSKRLKPVAEAQKQREKQQQVRGQQQQSISNELTNKPLAKSDNKAIDAPAAAAAAAAVAPLFTERTFDQRFAAFEAKVTRLATCPEEAGHFDFHIKEHSTPSSSLTSSKSDTSRRSSLAGEQQLSSSAVARKIDSLLVVDDRESFAGIKNLGDGERVKEVPITSVRGTVRGVKNRVRAGIATFQQQGPKVLSYKEKEAGKLIVYTTNLGVIRETYHKCQKVKTILRTLLVKFEERDVYLNREIQNEFRERTESGVIHVPQVYMDGMWLADADLLEKLNESGDLRRILKPFKRSEPEMECKKCGGYRMLPCGVCNGSKKSIHRNNFTLDFIALKCMNCDESGLEKCDACNGS